MAVILIIIVAHDEDEVVANVNVFSFTFYDGTDIHLVFAASGFSLLTFYVPAPA